jgi:hypothetical protein
MHEWQMDWTGPDSTTVSWYLALYYYYYYVENINLITQAFCISYSAVSLISSRSLFLVLDVEVRIFQVWGLMPIVIYWE